MAKSKKLEQSAEVEKKNTGAKILGKLKKLVITTVVLSVILAVMVVLWHNKRVQDYINYMFPEQQNEQIETLRQEVSAVRQSLVNMNYEAAQLGSIEKYIENLETRFDVLEEQNLNTIRSKADAAIILGIIERLDNIERRINEVAKVSDKGALIATAVMLVKDTAERGYKFVYESTVLSELAVDENRIQNSIEKISALADKGIASKEVLVRDFNVIYNKVEANNPEIMETGDWKDEFNKKFGKIITIKYKKTGEEIIEDEEVNLNDVFYLVNSNEIAKAVEELRLEKYKDILKEHPELLTWIELAEARVEFYESINHISSYSMGIMRANQFKN